jgi:hypothetical protein
LVALAVVKADRTIDEVADLRPAEVTFAAASVEIILELFPSLTVVLDFEEAGPLSPKRGRITAEQAEGDKLSEAWLVAVGKEAALVPTLEPQFGVRLVGGRRPATFPFNKVSQTGIVWRPGSARRAWLAHGGK